MAETVVLCGYAAPFNRTGWVDDGQECFDRRAFDAMLATGRLVSMKWGGHEVAAALAAYTGRVELFVDGYGLGFRAELDLTSPSGRANRWRLAEMTRAKDPVDQCSIGGLVIEKEVEESYLGSPRRRITEARFDHIAIVGGAVYGQKTGAWRSDWIEDAPWRLRALNERWEAGYSAHCARERARAAPVVARGARAIGHTVTGKIVMLTASGRLFTRPGPPRVWQVK